MHNIPQAKLDSDSLEAQLQGSGMRNKAWRVSATKGMNIGRVKENIGALLERYRCK